MDIREQTIEVVSLRERVDTGEVEIDGVLSTGDVPTGACVQVPLGDGLSVYAPIKSARASAEPVRPDSVTLVLDVPDAQTREDWLALCGPGDVLLLDVMPAEPEGSGVQEKNPYEAPASLERAQPINLWPSLLSTYASALLALVVSYLVGERLYYRDGNLDVRVLQVVMPQLMLLAVVPAVISTCMRPRSAWRAVVRGLLLGPVTFVGMYLLYPYLHRWLFRG